MQQLLSEAGESFDYLKSDIRNLSRYMAELEELIESYRAFAATATLSARGRSGNAAQASLHEHTKSLAHHRIRSQRRAQSLPSVRIW
ncbi:MAG TPA: hypothetical protein VIY29_03045 [Ktedonobacteraceae bacterium]